MKADQLFVSKEGELSNKLHTILLKTAGYLENNPELSKGDGGEEDTVLYASIVAASYAEVCVKESNKDTIDFLQCLIDGNLCSSAAVDLIKEFIKGLK